MSEPPLLDASPVFFWRLHYTTLAPSFQLGYNRAMTLVILLVLGYILGSVPFGYVMGKLFNVDITRTGSGNIGATNVLRAVGPTAGILVFILDMLKGTLAVVLATIYFSDPLLIILVGLSAILGHMFSFFLKFKGGKGSAVGLGVLLGITPDVFFFSFLLVVLVILISRYVSLASILGALATTWLMLLFQKPLPYFLAAFATMLLIIYKHKGNLSRLLQGTERKLGEK